MVLLNERQELEEDSQQVPKHEDLENSTAFDSASNEMSALLRRSKRHGRVSQGEENEGETCKLI